MTRVILNLINPIWCIFRGLSEVIGWWLLITLLDGKDLDGGWLLYAVAKSVGEEYGTIASIILFFMLLVSGCMFKNLIDYVERIVREYLGKA